LKLIFPSFIGELIVGKGAGVIIALSLLPNISPEFIILCAVVAVSAGSGITRYYTKKAANACSGKLEFLA
jgi:hypothetical protein